MRPGEALQGLALEGRPDSVACSNRGDRKVGSARPLDTTLQQALQRLQALRTLGVEIGRIVVPDPPDEGRLHLGIPGVVLLLERCHDLDGMLRWKVRMNDRVPQAPRGLLAQDLRIGVDDPIDRPVTDRVRPDVDAGLMQQTHHLPVDRRVNRRIAEITSIHFDSVLAPLLVNPGGAPGTAAVHVDLGTAREQPPIAQRFGRARQRLYPFDDALRRFHRRARVPEHTNVLGQLPGIEQHLVRIPVLLRVVRVFDRSHALAVQKLDHSDQTLPPLIHGGRRYQRRHEILGALLRARRSGVQCHHDRLSLRLGPTCLRPRSQVAAQRCSRRRSARWSARARRGCSAPRNRGRPRVRSGARRACPHPNPLPESNHRASVARLWLALARRSRRRWSHRRAGRP